MVMADGVAPARRHTTEWIGHVGLGLVAVLLFLLLHLTTGRLEVGGGEGWDGADYARMLRGHWSAGTIHTKQRPLIVWANMPAFAITQNAVQAFDAMNAVYAGLLAVALSMLLAHYGADPFMRVVAVICVALSNHVRLAVFYPVLVDLGACALFAFALLLIVQGRRWAAALACAAAMLAREYGPILILFGVHRDLRTRAPLRATVATYLPAALIWIGVRVLVRQAPAADDGITLQVLLDNRRLWWDPMFVALFAYFLIVCAGGLSMIAAADPTRCWRFLKREPEWISYAAPLVAVTALGGADLWRYLTPLLPLAALLCAAVVRGTPQPRMIAYAACAVVATFFTQQPFKHMSSSSYFADWFPYYLRQGLYPFDGPPPVLWPDWAWRFLAVTIAFLALLTFTQSNDSRVAAG